MPDSQPPYGGPGPYDGWDLDGLLSGENVLVPEGLRPVARTLDALRVAPMRAELAAEEAARTAFRQIMLVRRERTGLASRRDRRATHPRPGDAGSRRRTAPGAASAASASSPASATARTMAGESARWRRGRGRDRWRHRAREHPLQLWRAPRTARAQPQRHGRERPVQRPGIAWTRRDRHEGADRQADPQGLTTVRDRGWHGLLRRARSAVSTWRPSRTQGSRRTGRWAASSTSS